MFTRNKKKTRVSFFTDDEIKHIIRPLGEEDRSSSTTEVKKALVARKYEDSSDDDDLDSTLTGDIIGESCKSSTLFDDSEVSGQQMFGFKTPTRKNRLAQKVKESIVLLSPIVTPVDVHKRIGKSRTPVITPSKSQTKNTPNKTPASSKRPHNGLTPKTPASSRKLTNTPKTPVSQRTSILRETTNTPYSLRAKFKQKLAKQALIDELGQSSGSEFSLSESESDSDASDVDETNQCNKESKHDNENDCSDTDESIENKPLNKPTLPTQRIGTRTRSSNQELKYVINADEYFRMGNTKALTSNHTLSRLKTPRLPPDELRTLLNKTKPTHEASVNSLLNEQKELFAKWTFTLSQGYSVLVYGVGSKRPLLNAFHRDKLSDWPVVVCNGFFPSLTIKEIVDSILDGVLALEQRPRSLMDSIECVERAFRRNGRHKMVLIVHNLDGPCLRASKNQDILSRIVALPNVRLIASIDHVNSPSMWDQSMLSLYNFTYWDSTSLLPYTDETSFESSLLVERSGALVLSSLRNVFRSLTTNAQGIFLVIVSYQLERAKSDRQYTGMPFKDLYRRCREELLVSSDQTLRAQLTEFLDHKLVVARRGAGGAEVLNIPLQDQLLETFVEQRAEAAN